MPQRQSRKTFADRLDHLVGQLRSRILDGTYAEDDFLPAESALAKQFDLSNNSVRKGLEQLVAEGLIVKIDKVGSRVAANSSHQRTTITIACYPSIERDVAFTELLEDFHRLYPAIRVKPITASPLTDSGSYAGTIRESVANGTADLYTVHHMDFTELIAEGAAERFEPLVPAPGTYPFLNERFAVDGTGESFVQPLMFTPLVLCYNKDHFAEAGLLEPDSSWTWQHLLDSAARLTVPGKRHGFHFFALSDNRWPFFLLQTGAGFARDDCGYYAPTDSAQLLGGIRLCGDIIGNRDVFPPYLSENQPEATRLFAEGKISMQLATYNSLNDLKREALRYDIAPVPLPTSGSPATLAIAIGLMAGKASQHKEAVKLFISYAASHEAQRAIRSRTLSIPACKPAAEAAERAESAQPNGQQAGLNRPEHFQLFRDIIPSFRWHADLGLPIPLLKPLHRLLKLYWSSMIDDDTLLAELSRLSFPLGADRAEQQHG
ncbi:extracellular solute-binding protein [Paenibacillus hodogayensis]|uniref:Extracellular solute-binding protein n=1 Tax=Paenibacillus hodogayensis TaxID=279208 RepID=A0ABV5VT97_9BACL